MHFRKYSRQYLIDVILFFIFVIATLTQEYFHFQNPFVSAFSVVYVLIYPAKFLLALVDLRMRSMSLMAIICVATAIGTIEFLGMSISVAGSALGMAIFTKASVQIVMTLSILFLMVISRDLKIPAIKVDAPHYLYLSVFLIVLACLGSVLMTQYQENIVNLVFWVLILIVSMVLILKKDLTTQTKLMMVFSISLSCLLNYVVIANFITGYDIFYEYSVANTTMAEGVWNIDFGSNVNAMLSITVFAPAMAWLGNTDLLWILKLVFPAIFSLVPVAVFIFASKMGNEKAGVLGALLYILIQGFLFEMPSIARQEIGEVFLISIFMVAMMDEFTPYQKATLGTIFGFGLITSHYATTLLFFGLTGLYYIIRLMFRAKDKPFFTGWHLLTIIVIEMTWLLYVGSKGVMGSIFQVIDSVYSAVFNEMSFTSTVVADRVSASVSLLHTIGKYGFILTIGIIALGVLARLYQRRKNMDNYTALATAFGVLMVVSLTASNFLVLFGDIRMISLLLIVAGAMFYFGLSWFFNLPLLRTQRKRMMYAAAAIVAIYMLFNSGLAYSIANDGPISIALSNDILYPKFSDPDLKTASWTQSHLVTDQQIAGDRLGRAVVGGYGWFNVDRDNKLISPIDKGELIYLGTRNVVEMKYADPLGVDHPISIDQMYTHPIVYCTEDSRVQFVYLR